MSQGSGPDTAIITVTYNSADFITGFLDSIVNLLEGSEPNPLLVVVDNASTDSTVEIVRHYIAAKGVEERILLRPQKDNVGFGRGCNAGVEAARPYGVDYYWFLNPDTRVYPDTGRELVHFLQREKADFVGSQLVNEEGVPRPSAFRFPSATSELCRSVRLGALDKLMPKGRLDLPVAQEPYRADWLTGASFMVRRDAFDSLHGFDPHFFLYFEEVDLFFRARQQGFTCWCNPASQVYHFAGASTGISHSRKATKPRPQYWFDSRRYFYCKNFGRAYFMLCDLAALSGLAVWQLRVRLQRKDNSDPPGLFKAIACNSLVLNRSRI